jgi:ribonuclease P protein component
LREALRVATRRLEEGWDLVFIVRPAAADASYQDIAAAADALLERAGLVSGESP